LGIHTGGTKYGDRKQRSEIHKDPLRKQRF
jgi:hypothetical protein